MLALPDVTLVLIETREHELAALALRDCLGKIEFGDVLIFTNDREPFRGARARYVDVPDWPDKLGWSRCFWYDVPKHVRTSHALGIQWDSWVVDPTMWRDEYLERDYIGAPWWHKDGLNVGNGGFSLRSTRLLRYIYKHRDQFPCVSEVDDNLYCRKYRPALMDAGFNWAPEAQAFDFAFEYERPDPTAHHFGFHACFNFDYGCEGDEQRLLERAELMQRSDYIRNIPYMWKEFAKKCPGIVEKIKENGYG